MAKAPFCCRAGATPQHYRRIADSERAGGAGLCANALRSLVGSIAPENKFSGYRAASLPPSPLPGTANAARWSACGGGRLVSSVSTDDSGSRSDLVARNFSCGRCLRREEGKPVLLHSPPRRYTQPTARQTQLDGQCNGSGCSRGGTCCGSST